MRVVHSITNSALVYNCLHSKMSYKCTLILVAYFILKGSQVLQAHRKFNVDGGQTIFTLENETIDIHCRKNMAIEYCGFIHPSGKRFSFSGFDLNDGLCAIRINVTKHDTGEWTCYLGKSAGPETMEKIQVKIANELAAVRSNLSVENGKDVTLECVTTHAMRPLSYCRFEPPNDRPFSIHHKVQSHMSILGRYYFPQNKSLDRGDCAVTIRNVEGKDEGVWTCGAGLDDGKEHIDFITVEVQKLISTTKASTWIFLTAFIPLLIIIACLIFFWIRRDCKERRQARQALEMEQLGPSQSTERPKISPKLESNPQTESNLPSIVVQSPSDSGTPRTASPML